MTKRSKQNSTYIIFALEYIFIRQTSSFLHHKFITYLSKIDWLIFFCGSWAKHKSPKSLSPTFFFFYQDIAAPGKKLYTVSYISYFLLNFLYVLCPIIYDKAIQNIDFSFRGQKVHWQINNLYLYVDFLRQNFMWGTRRSAALFAVCHSNILERKIFVTNQRKTKST